MVGGHTRRLGAQRAPAFATGRAHQHRRHFGLGLFGSFTLVAYRRESEPGVHCVPDRLRLGIVVGILRGRAAHVDAAFVVPAEMLRPIPPLGLIPLFILWFGIGELSKILLILISVFLIMMVNAQAGTRSCPLDLTRAALSLGARRGHLFRYVILPAALPQIMTGLRVSMGTALSILVASELLGGDRGLGFIVLDASNFFRTTYVFAGIFVIGLIGLLSDRGLALLTRRVVHWEGRR
jgi:NitT/TauT family transport system permease protein/taurine transport system permease protein